MKRDGYQCAKLGPQHSLIELTKRQSGHLTFSREVLNHLFWGETAEDLLLPGSPLPYWMVLHIDPTPRPKASFHFKPLLQQLQQNVPLGIDIFKCIIPGIQLEIKVLRTTAWKGAIFANHKLLLLGKNILPYIGIFSSFLTFFCMFPFSPSTQSTRIPDEEGKGHNTDSYF